MEKFCQHCKAYGGPYQTHNTLDCHCYDSNGKPLEAAAGKPSESKKHFKKSRGDKHMAFMQSMFKAKPMILRTVRSGTMTSVTVPTGMKRKLGTATWDLV
jgi:hypothetical protein